MQLNELRKELQFNTELVQLIETLKNIAASQYHMMEREKRRFNEFMNAFSKFFRVVDLVDVDDPLARSCCDVECLVVVTSDSGFMGGLNQGVLRAALRRARGRPAEQTAFVVIGDKGAQFFLDAERPFRFFPGIDETAIYERAAEIKEYLVGEVLARRVGRVSVVYPRPVSFSAQTIETVDILPCGELFDREAESEVSRRVRGQGLLADARRVIVESSFPDMVEYLAGMWVASKLFEIFEDGKLAEFSARAMHLEGSFQKVQKEQKRLRHQCFKAAHEKIDKGMRETFSARSKKRKRRAPEPAARLPEGVTHGGTTGG